MPYDSQASSWLDPRTARRASGPGWFCLAAGLLLGSVTQGAQPAGSTADWFVPADNFFASPRIAAVPLWEPEFAPGPPTSTEQLPPIVSPSVPLPEGPELVPSPSPTAPADEPVGEPGDSPSEVPPEEVPFDSGILWLPPGWEEWLLAKYWSGSLEIGINSTEGNSDTFSSRMGGKLKRKTDLWELKADATYVKSTAGGNETQHHALFNSGYERTFGETAWSHFGKFNMEYDEFKAFDLRLVMNAGFGYRLVKTEIAEIKSRFGAGTSHEIGGPDDRWVSEAVFGLDLQHQLSSRQRIELTSDYFPEWGDFSNYRLVTDASWTVALDEESKLSLKLSVNERYDSTPNGRKPTDITYALLLLWQL